MVPDVYMSERLRTGLARLRPSIRRRVLHAWRRTFQEPAGVETYWDHLSSLASPFRHLFGISLVEVGPLSPIAPPCGGHQAREG